MVAGKSRTQITENVPMIFLRMTACWNAKSQRSSAFTWGSCPVIGERA